MNAPIVGTMPGSDGTLISYRVDGPTGAPWLILSNSLATDRRMWDPQIDALAATRRILRYDTRGHGQSEPGQAPYDFNQLTGDVLSLCGGLGIERADFLGLSLGGMTGLALAMRDPKLIGRLVCCDARAVAPDAYKAMWDGNIALANEHGMAGLIEPTISRWFTANFLDDPANKGTLDGVRAMIAGTSATGYVGAASLLQGLDLIGGLSDLRCETHYLTGDSDMAAPADVMQDMADRTPGASLTVLSKAAHLSNIEQPQAFTRAVQEFLDR